MKYICEGAVGNQVDITLEAVGHTYTVQGLPSDMSLTSMPSVTKLVHDLDGGASIPLQRWGIARALEVIEAGGDIPTARATPEKLFKQSGERGTQVHHMLEQFLKHVDAPLTDHHYQDLVEHFNSIERFLGDWRIRGLEMRVFHPQSRIGGSIDIMASRCVDGEVEIFVCDLKTGKAIRKPNDFFQVSCYVHCLAEMLRLGIEIWNGCFDEVESDLSNVTFSGGLIHLHGVPQCGYDSCNCSPSDRKLSFHAVPDEMLADGGNLLIAMRMINEMRRIRVPRKAVL